jgi:hypothetical protein
MAFAYNTTSIHNYSDGLLAITAFTLSSSQERSREDPPSPPPQPPPSPVNWSRPMSDIDDMSLEMVCWCHPWCLYVLTQTASPLRPWGSNVGVIGKGACVRKRFRTTRLVTDFAFLWMVHAAPVGIDVRAYHWLRTLRSLICKIGRLLYFRGVTRRTVVSFGLLNCDGFSVSEHSLSSMCTFRPSRICTLGLGTQITSL